MDVIECSDFVEAALSSIRAGFEVAREGDACLVRGPFLRRDGDSFEVFVRSSDDEFSVSDDGSTLDYLELSGVRIRRNRSFDRLLAEVSRAHSVGIVEGSLMRTVEGLGHVGEAITSVLAAMNDLSHFELTKRQKQPVSFGELVESELVGLGLPYRAGVSLPGAVRERTFQFFLNGSRNVVLEPLQARDSTRAVHMADVLIVNVQDVLKKIPELRAVAVVDDSRDIWRDRALPDLVGFGVNVVKWSQRHSDLRAAIERPRIGTADMFLDR